MSYELGFLPDALSEGCRLDASIREVFKKKLQERPQNPRVPAARLAGRPDRFKIKLRTLGHRLVYEVRDAEWVVIVVAVGKRNAAYKAAARR